MAKQLLIDAAHPEETRVAAVDNGNVVGFEYESTAKQQIIGNIYLARVVRIEAALQSVFVEYGGNRHGFLAFPEIHKDYYNIPVADQRAEAEPSDDEIRNAPDADSEPTDPDAGADDGTAKGDAAREGGKASAGTAASDASGGKPQRTYRVQEVIRKSQILLVQVTKGERGTKGAALTTYISLAGRYCVLMPNSDRGGGVSRKITTATDRRKLKQIISDIEVPREAGLIIRTAGINRTKQEIRRDYDFLVRQWNEIRELTLKSIAPAKIYEEGNLIRRTIRDDYSKDMEAVLVQGEDGYRTAKDFMKMIMPSHAKKVKKHADASPIFAHHGIEGEVSSLLDPVVQLKSGGHIVIDRTEALVAVDVNSGRATRQGTLEKTALQTNLEAAEAIAAQMRLRDLAGLIVIDFIDMEEQKNNQAVERRLKDCVKSDRSRIQLGQISGFGLLEMSRQRLKPGIFDIATSDCGHCNGSGRVRADESFAIEVLRRIEAEAAKDGKHAVHATVPLRIANYLLNWKRDAVQAIEARQDVSVIISGVEPLEDQNTEIRRVKQTVSQTGDEDEQVIGIDTPFRTAEAENRSERRSDGQRRRRKRSQRGGSGHKQQQGQKKAGPEENTGDLTAEGPDGDADKSEKKKTVRKRTRRQRKPASDGAHGDAQTADAPKPEDSPSETGRSRSARRRRKSSEQKQSHDNVGAAPSDKPDNTGSDSKRTAAAAADADAGHAPSDGSDKRIAAPVNSAAD